MRRLAVVLAAYGLATLVGTAALTAALAIRAALIGEGFGLAMIKIMFVFGLPLFLVIGSALAAPITFLTEVQRGFGSGWERRWPTYILAGSLFGIIPFLVTGASTWEFLLFVTPSAALAGFVYWFISWRCFPPLYVEADAMGDDGET